MSLQFLELYQQVILQHNKNPKNFGKLEEASSKFAGHNKMCGDYVVIQISFCVDDNFKKYVSKIAFEGEGCAILKASASIMTELLKDKTLDQIHGLLNDFRRILSGDLESSETLHQANIFAGLTTFPSRVQCAALPWDTLHKGILTL